MVPGLKVWGLGFRVCIQCARGGCTLYFRSRAHPLIVRLPQHVGQGRAGPGRAGPGRAGQGRARQGKAPKNTVGLNGEV